MHVMRRMKNTDNRMAVLKTLSWVILLAIFTYTTLFAELFKSEGNVLCAYYKMQETEIALLVNLGILGMVMVDYFGTRLGIDGKKTLDVFIGIFAIFIVYIHSGIMSSGTGSSYICIVNNNFLSLVAHLVFLSIASYFKYLSLRKPKEERSFVATTV